MVQAHPGHQVTEGSFALPAKKQRTSCPGWAANWRAVRDRTPGTRPHSFQAELFTDFVQDPTTFAVATPGEDPEEEETAEVDLAEEAVEGTPGTPDTPVAPTAVAHGTPTAEEASPSAPVPAGREASPTAALAGQDCSP